MFGEERRDSFVRASLKHRDLMPRIDSKKIFEEFILVDILF